jgi:hypothetical protein
VNQQGFTRPRGASSPLSRGSGPHVSKLESLQTACAGVSVCACVRVFVRVCACVFAFVRAWVRGCASVVSITPTSTRQVLT